MTIGNNQSAGIPSLLVEYLRAIRSWWYVAVAVFIVTTAATAFYAFNRGDVFETTTSLLIVSPVSERAQGSSATQPFSSVLGTPITPKELQVLASAPDLLETVIDRLQLTSGDGELLSVDELQSRMVPPIEEDLPVLRMTVSGADPNDIQRTADTWATAFIERNSELFTSEAGRVFEFASTQYDSMLAALRLAEDQRVLLTVEGSPTTLRAELNAMQDTFRTFLERDEEGRALLVTVRARLDSLRAAVAAEPPVISLERGVDLDTVVQVVAGSATADVIQLLDALTLSAEEPNPVYLDLRRQLLDLQTGSAGLEQDILYLDTRIAELAIAIETKGTELADFELADSRLRQEVSRLNAGLDRVADRRDETLLISEGEAGAIQVLQGAIVPSSATSPNRLQILVLGAVGGLLLGILVAILLSYWRALDAPPPARRD